MIGEIHRGRRQSIVRRTALTCVFVVLVVGTLQATHIHREWNAPAGHQTSLRPDTGKDSQCVFCLTSHAAADLPLHFSGVHIQTSVAGLRAEPTIHHPTLVVSSDTIRPPPTA